MSADKKSLANALGIWIVVAVLVAGILGGAVYLAKSRQEPANMRDTARERASEPPTQERSAEQTAENNTTEAGNPVNGEAPEPVEQAEVSQQTGEQAAEQKIPAGQPHEPQGPARLQLDNLAGSLKLSIPALEGGRLPLTYTCYRDGLTPPLTWSAAPEGTRSFALFMEQRKPDKNAYVNWVLFNIPAEKTGFPAGPSREAELPDGTRFGRNDNGVADYAGPCDPRGQVDYAIRLFALDTMLDEDARVTKDDLIRAMNGHIIDEAEATFYHILRP